MSRMEEFTDRRLGEFIFLDVLLDRKTRPVLIYVIIVIAIGAAIFHWVEGWSWLDSAYFVVVTLTTIGYGDFAPATPLGKAITIFYGVNGVIFLLMLFDTVRRLRRWELGDPWQETESQT